MSEPLDLVLTALQPILVTGVLAGVGALMAAKGTLDARGISVVAGLCFYVFTPAVCFSTLAQNISLNAISGLWPLLVNQLISIAMGFVLGFIAAAVLRTPREFRNIVVTAVAFGNVGNLPLVFVAALCNDEGAMFHQKLGAACNGIGIAYTAFFFCINVLIQFTVGVQMLMPVYIALHQALTTTPSQMFIIPSQQQLTSANLDGVLPPSHSDAGELEPTENGLETAFNISKSSARLHKVPSLSDWGTDSDEASPDNTSIQRTIENGVHRTISDNDSSRSSSGEIIKDCSVELQPLSPAAAEYKKSTSLSLYTRLNSEGLPISFKRTLHHSDTWRGKYFSNPVAGVSPFAVFSSFSYSPITLSNKLSDGASRFKTRIRAINWMDVFPLPSQAALVGLFVGCVPVLKSLFYGTKPPLGWLAESFTLLGQGLVPGAIPLLGAVLLKGPSKSALGLKTALGVVVTRLVILPGIMTGMVMLLIELGFYQIADSMELLLILLSSATPTALNLQTITVVYGYGASEMSALLFYQYLAILVTMPAYMTWFLAICEKYTG